MENNQDSSIFEFNIDDEAKSSFSSIARWANINAIVGFIGIGVSVIAFVISLIRINQLTGSPFAAVPGILGLIFTLIIGLVLNITLINAAINIKIAVDHSSQGSLVTGLTKLATYFKIFGILTIISLVIVALVLLVIMMFGSGQRF